MKEFINSVKKNAKQLGKRIAFPEAEDERILKACDFLSRKRIVVPVLIGSPDRINEKANEFRVSLKGIEIIDPDGFDDFQNYAEELFGLRKKKGMTLKKALETLKDPIYLATMLLHFGRVDGLVSGACHPTAHTLRPALQIIKTKPGVLLASSYFLMVKDKQMLVFADCGFNINPDSGQLAQIAVSTAETAKTFGIEPRVALLSFSTKGSATHKDADKVIKALEFVKKKDSSLLVDGELQFDAAFVERVAKLKCPDSPLQGNANVFIFPDLDAGNISYKVAQYLGGYAALGPLVQGLKRPVNDLSRGCSVDDVVMIAAITAVQAGQE